MAKAKVSAIKPTFHIEWWDAERPVDYPLNARKWKPEAVAKVAASITAYGWRQPIVVDKAGVIVIGHLRRAAARHVGLAQVPVHVAADLSPEAIRGLRLADNRTHDEAEWDMDLLAREFGELKALDFHLESTGFSLREIDKFTLSVNPAEDDVPPVPEVPVTKPGDLWLIGAHRLICGDCTIETDVRRLLNGVTPALLVSDPPYGVEYDPGWRVEAGVNQNRSKLGKVQNDCRADWRDAWALFPGDVMYVWHAGKHAATVQQSIEACGFEIRSQIIWAKDRFALSRGNYHWQHEPCWYAVRNDAHWNGDRSQSTLWQIKSREDGGHGHGTQKPVECMRRPMLNNSNPGQVVYDPFLESGTALIAAETVGRSCYGLEISPAFCDCIVKRWENLTGKKAVLDGVPRV